MASGNCGSADTEEPTEVVLDLDITSHKYDLHLIPGPGTVDLKGGNSSCTHPFVAKNRVLEQTQFVAYKRTLE